METNKDRAEYLADKWMRKDITPEEEMEFHKWYQRELYAPIQLPEDFADSQEEHRQRILESIETAINRPVRKLWSGIAAAASLILIAGIGLFLYNLKAKNDNQQEMVAFPDIAPGKQSATLTLANGRKIRLNNAQNGTLAKEAGVLITKTQEGQLTYEIKGSVSGAKDINILSTAKGETYKVRLPDGSLVYLNAASSLTYATSLNKGGKRVVKLTGEGYFEIAKDPLHPFVVETNKQTIQVLGTHFNVNSYAEENVSTTTLIEGLVHVTPTSGTRVPQTLNPGEQIVIESDNAFKIRKVSVENEIAWKNGEFIFNDEPLEGILRKLARWYDIDIVYEQNVDRSQLFAGGVSRYGHISGILKKMEKTGGIHFKIEGRRIIVTN